ncbi:MAG TPA: ester cyclase [Puia sp.]
MKHSISIALTSLLLTTGVSHAQTIHNNQKKETMSTIQRNEAVVRRVYEQSFNKRDFGSLRELLSDEYPGFEGVKGPEGFIKPVQGLINAFPDIQYTIEDLFGEGDKVVVRWRWSGHHMGTFRDYAPTGKTINNDGMAIFVLKDGKIINGVVQTDRLGFLQEINAVPTNPGKPAAKDKISLIDKFLVPAASKAEFYERMHINRSFLHNLPGLIRQDAYEYTDQDGNLVCVTVAQWESKEAIAKAKEAVQAEYKREGFDMPGMLKRLNITMDRGIYSDVRE